MPIRLNIWNYWNHWNVWNDPVLTVACCQLGYLLPNRKWSMKPIPNGPVKMSQLCQNCRVTRELVIHYPSVSHSSPSVASFLTDI
jgi:hypothetical protein